MATLHGCGNNVDTLSAGDTCRRCGYVAPSYNFAPPEPIEMTLTVIVILLQIESGRRIDNLNPLIMHDLQAEGLIEPGASASAEPAILLTPRGRKYVQMLRDVPLPVQVWADPRTSPPNEVRKS